MYPQPNKYGVYPDENAECIEYKVGRERVTILLLQIDESTWIKSCDVEYKNGGMAEPLSEPESYATRNEALLSALNRAESYSRNYAPRISMWASEQIKLLMNPSQLELFK